MKELLHLLDTLEDTVEDARSEHFTGHARVDRRELYAIVEEIRRAIPGEIEQAHWIARKRDEMLAEARREAERTLQEARRESARLLAAEEVIRQAERRAATIVERARSPERRIRLEAEAYAEDILKGLVDYFERFAEAVQRGRDRLPERTQG